jgi:RNA polymerase sigma factor (sigma-70 family)
MKWIQRVVLTQEQEEAFIRAAQEGDLSARNTLVESHLPFIRMIASKRRCPSWLEPEDLVQAAVFGFIKAIEKWQPDKNCRLLGYAKWWMRNALDKEIEFSRAYRVPGSVAFLLKAGRKVGEKTRKAAENFREMTCFSDQDDPIDPRKIVDPAIIVEKIDLNELVHEVIAELSQRHQKVVKLRMAGMTLKRIGEILDLGTKENTRLIEAEAHREFAVKWRSRHEDMYVNSVHCLQVKSVQPKRDIVQPSKVA